MEIKTILLVEDNEQDAELIIEALSQINIAKRIVAVGDGVEAIQYLRYDGEFKTRAKRHPDVILLDIKMPRMDGIELLEAIRKDDELRSIPVVMLSSSREDTDLKRCYEFGVNAFVVKPLEFTQFMETVKSTGIFWTVLNERPAPFKQSG